MLVVDTFENLLSESDMSLSEIADAIGIPKSQLSAYFTSKGKKTIDFVYLLRAVRVIKPDYEEAFMKAICPCFLRPRNLRAAMEYASTFNYFDLQRVLYEVNVVLGRENKDFAEIYLIYLDFQEGKVDKEEILARVNLYTPKCYETEIMKVIILCSLYYVKKDYKMVYKLSYNLDELVGKIKTEYIRESYMSRACDLIARSYLYYKNDVKKARFFATSLMKNEFSAYRRIHADYIMSISYFYEDYQLCMNYMKKYKRSLIETGNVVLAEELDNKEIPFVKNHWNKNKSIVSNDMAEVAHFHAKNGNKEEALNVLKAMEPLTPFQLYYKGIVLNDPQVLSLSFVEFMKLGNRFFANLPKNELKKYENYGFFAELLYNKTGNIF
ncbi:AimR family lysis-lysogeny pheromone receptor [Bacillus sp. MCCB 382]|uniref:AimR family lysis-lysogeny pheromone receptor n=1 Tax=Bacillus sp. MCCB 382 TaxID=2860197 RepID=UPI001C563FED|nr:AimR family lysis-lysogeny pheromone receptor [Bacillus sp. MCCB 382]